ncbi:MAG: hypothetical protein CMJ46_01295 [Planctomyces sp.]|nr:hypothetical protein [Planctomyces sp.]
MAGFAGFQLLSQPDAVLADSSGDSKAELKPIESDPHEFMEYVFQPNYKKLKAALASEPTDGKGWYDVKSGALILSEGGNLLLMRTPDEKADEWNSHAVHVRDLAAEVYHAAHDKNYDKAVSSYKEMLKSCNDCHNKVGHGEPNLKP